MVLFSCLTLGATLMLPRRDCTSGTIGGILFLLGSTLLAYSTDDLRILLAAWIVSTVPFLREQWFGARYMAPAAGTVAFERRTGAGRRSDCRVRRSRCRSAV